MGKWQWWTAAAADAPHGGKRRGGGVGAEAPVGGGPRPAAHGPCEVAAAAAAPKGQHGLVWPPPPVVRCLTAAPLGQRGIQYKAPRDWPGLDLASFTAGVVLMGACPAHHKHEQASLWGGDG
eukprot:EG_transcript_9873